MNSKTQNEIPAVNWLDLETDRDTFMNDLTYAPVSYTHLTLPTTPYV